MKLIWNVFYAGIFLVLVLGYVILGWLSGVFVSNLYWHGLLTGVLDTLWSVAWIGILMFGRRMPLL